MSEQPRMLEEPIDIAIGHLERAGVLAAGEIDRIDLRTIIEGLELASVSLADVIMALEDYQVEHVVRFDNLALFDRASITDKAGRLAIAGACARMARYSGAMTDLSLEDVPDRNVVCLRYCLDGSQGRIDLKSEAGAEPLSLIEALTELLDPDPSFSVAIMGRFLLLTRLGDSQRSDLNSALQREGVAFAPVVVGMSGVADHGKPSVDDTAHQQ